MKRFSTVAFLLVTGIVVAGAANASELVYTPKNPNFGGNPLISNFLLDSARIQNPYVPPSGSGGGGGSPTFDFGGGGGIGGPTIIINPVINPPVTPPVTPG